jgi:hypothetical protein
VRQHALEQRDERRGPGVPLPCQLLQLLQQELHPPPVVAPERQLDERVETGVAQVGDPVRAGERLHQKFLGRVRAGRLRRHGGEQQALGALLHLERQPVQPRLQDVGRHERGAALADLHDQPADVLPRLGVEQQTHRLLVLPAAAQDGGRGPPRLGHLPEVEVVLEGRCPQPVQRPPPRARAYDQGQPVEQGPEVHVPAEQRGGDLLVRPADGDEQCQCVAALRRQLGQQLLPDVPADGERARRGRQLGQGRPAPDVAEQLR